MIKELEQVILKTDIPQHSLKRGDIGTVVLVHQGEKVYEVEFVSLDGETIAVTSLDNSQIRPISNK